MKKHHIAIIIISSFIHLCLVMSFFWYFKEDYYALYYRYSSPKSTQERLIEISNMEFFDVDSMDIYQIDNEYNYVANYKGDQILMKRARARTGLILSPHKNTIISHNDSLTLARWINFFEENHLYLKYNITHLKISQRKIEEVILGNIFFIKADFIKADSTNNKFVYRRYNNEWFIKERA